jgi:hypothetical protein
MLDPLENILSGESLSSENGEQFFLICVYLSLKSIYLSIKGASDD